LTSDNYREKRQARKDGATPVPNSGRGFRKGDAVWRTYLVDYKHNAKSFTLTSKAWAKHGRDAWNDSHKDPMIKVIFEDGTEIAIVSWDCLVALEQIADEV
jgi:hypothetical protein